MRRPPKGWRRSTFGKRSERYDGVTSVPCFTHPNAPGLVVNETGFRWVVSHARSGSFINPTFPIADDACLFALAIAVLGDFERSARDILADEALRGGVVLIRQRPEFRNAETEAGWKEIPVDVLDA